MPDITMPKLSDTMEEGKILRWLKQPGQPVEIGEVLVEVETDKADMEIEAEQGGVLREIRLQEGDSGPVGAVIAVVDDGSVADAAPGAAPEAPAATEAPSAAAETPAAAPVVTPTPTSAAASAPAPAATPATPAAASTQSPAGTSAAHAASTAPPAAGTAKVSPLARTRAAELGVDPTTLRGTGPGGRVTRKDVEAAHAASTPTAPAPAKPEPGQPGSGTVTVRPPPAKAAPSFAPRSGDAAAIRRIPLTGMRAAIARRMTESKREAPHFYVTTVADMDRAVELRAGLKASGGVAAGVTYNHLILKACADALVAVPEMNARFAGDAIEVLPEVNLGMATAVPEGLIVPVLHDADRSSLFDIAARARELGEKAKQRTFGGKDLSGGTFSVSNLGMYDVESFVAVINPPQAGILAVGSVAQRPVVRDGELRVGHTVHLTVSCDHRAVDGARAAEFLTEVRKRLENPVSLLVPQGEE
ncbi:MAG: dihydrolipoamide acetyltransferase family protein [Candidatus Binatia bacterium]|nr:dihydrolipoamide acetyltransferase family protein [Candidatus Binatia bacterium]